MPKSTIVEKLDNLPTNYAMNRDGFLPLTALRPHGQFGSTGKAIMSSRCLPLLQRGWPMVSLHPPSQVYVDTMLTFADVL